MRTAASKSGGAARGRKPPRGWDAYYRVVARVPAGRVATYAQIALLAGRPRAARHVGYALAALRGTRHRIPWQRVLGKRPGPWAAVAIRDPIGAAAQRVLLEREGVALDGRGRVSLERYGWKPRRQRRTSTTTPAVRSAPDDGPTPSSPASRSRSAPRTP